MPATKTKIALTRSLPADIEARMSELFSVTLNTADTALSRDQLVALMQSHDVLVPTLTDKIDAELIAQAGSQLKLIANFGTGTDNIDIDAAYAQGITVTNTPSVLTEDTADMTMALILAVSRRMLEGDHIMRRPGEFTGWSPNLMLGQRISGKKLGIIGMGRIGQALARRAAAFGMEIHYHNRSRLSPELENGATYHPDVKSLFAQSEFLSFFTFVLGKCPSPSK